MCKNRKAAIVVCALLAASAFAQGSARAQGHGALADAPRATPQGRTAAPAGRGVAAADASSKLRAPNDRSIVAELLAINERIALLSAQLKEVELKANIAAKERDLAQGVSAVADAGFGSELPVVRAIDGVDKRLRATLAWSGGITETAGEGDRLPGGWRVTGIDLDAVELSRGGESVRLGFGSVPLSPAKPSSASPYGAAASVGLPGAH